MLEMIMAGGWMMWPLLVCSVIVVGVAGERYWTLNPQKIVPNSLLAQIWNLLKQGQLNSQKIKIVHDNSPLGQVLAAGLSNTQQGREIMVESMEVAASRVQYDLEKFLSLLSSIANVAPLLGLLGTVIGTIKIFAVIMLEGGTGNPGAFAGGISEALICTAMGLVVAIPASLVSRYFYRLVDGFMVTIQQDAIKLVDALHSNRTVKNYTEVSPEGKTERKSENPRRKETQR